MNFLDIDKSKFTPMMQQYLDLKKDYQDAIVFFRIGDFYEMFFDDAAIASKELEIALTGKDAGVSERVPMCGIPFHAYAPYAKKLVDNGHKVAIAEQIEDPALAKGIVKRGVIKIITPGTVVELGLSDKENNYIVSIGYVNKKYVLCYADVSTGESFLTLFNSFDLLLNEILSLHAKEVIALPSFNKSNLDLLRNNYQIVVSFEENKEVPKYLSYVCAEIAKEYHYVIGILLNYIINTQRQEIKHMQKMEFYSSNDYLRLDAFTKRNLELTETLRTGTKSGSLLWLLDECETAMGSRMLHRYLDRPLVNQEEIEQRLDCVEAFNNNYVAREEIRECLKTVYDLERILGRISCGGANAKDLVQLRKTLSNMPKIKELLESINQIEIQNLGKELNPHQELYKLLEDRLLDNPPFTIKEGGMIKEGYNAKLDEIKDISNNSKKWIADFEEHEREHTGIKTLKVGYNRVFGYYIEVSKGAVANLPDDTTYERKQTLANAERFITPELKKYEEIVIHSKEQIENLEYDIFVSLRDDVSKYIFSLQALANLIAHVDVMIAFSIVSMKYHYVRPTFSNDRSVNIINGRHPVLESLVKENYVSNDVVINSYNMILITGPNMSGKSTYMKMFAEIAILAQIGSFVPASVAKLMIFDQIFTRIGASDDIISGQSTFMVEMIEANYAISNATKNSLILFDEIGRGTATFDGMALAQAILEYIHERIGAVTLFSTHYHELVALEGTLKRLKNVHVEAKETDNGVAFLHKVLDGPTDKSYGINVASLAGLPKSLIERSKQILNVLEADNKAQSGVHMDLFNFEAYEEQPEVKNENKLNEIKEQLQAVDVNMLTPLEALNFINDLKSKL